MTVVTTLRTALPTHGIHTRLPAATLAEVLTGVGDAIDAIGGRFRVRYAAVAVTAARRRRVSE